VKTANKNHELFKADKEMFLMKVKSAAEELVCIKPVLPRTGSCRI